MTGHQNLNIQRNCCWKVGEKDETVRGPSKQALPQRNWVWFEWTKPAFLLRRCLRKGGWAWVKWLKAPFCSPPPPSVPTSPCISRSKRKEIQWAQWLSEGSAQGFCEGFLQNTENMIARRRQRQRVNAGTLCRATIGVGNMGNIVFVSPSSYKAIMSTMWKSTSWQNRWGIICSPLRWLSEINLNSEFKFPSTHWL